MHCIKSYESQCLAAVLAGGKGIGRELVVGGYSFRFGQTVALVDIST